MNQHFTTTYNKRDEETPTHSEILKDLNNYAITTMVNILISEHFSGDEDAKEDFLGDFGFNAREGVVLSSITFSDLTELLEELGYKAKFGLSDLSPDKPRSEVFTFDHTFTPESVLPQTVICAKEIISERLDELIDDDKTKVADSDIEVPEEMFERLKTRLTEDETLALLEDVFEFYSWTVSERIGNKLAENEDFRALVEKKIS